MRVSTQVDWIRLGSVTGSLMPPNRKWPAENLRSFQNWKKHFSGKCNPCKSSDVQSATDQRPRYFLGGVFEADERVRGCVWGGCASGVLMPQGARNNENKIVKRYGVRSTYH
jgi:hypothetical protein